MRAVAGDMSGAEAEAQGVAKRAGARTHRSASNREARDTPRTTSYSSPSISASVRPFSARNLRFATASSCLTWGEVRKARARCMSSVRSVGGGGSDCTGGGSCGLAAAGESVEGAAGVVWAVVLSSSAMVAEKGRIRAPVPRTERSRTVRSQCSGPSCQFSVVHSGINGIRYRTLVYIGQQRHRGTRYDVDRVQAESVPDSWGQAECVIRSPTQRRSRHLGLRAQQQRSPLLSFLLPRRRAPCRAPTTSRRSLFSTRNLQRMSTTLLSSPRAALSDASRA